VTGRILAERTGMALVDMDALIEERQKRTIPEIFNQPGFCRKNWNCIQKTLKF